MQLSSVYMVGFLIALVSAGSGFDSHSLLYAKDVVKANGLEFEVERGYPKELLEPYDFNAPAGPVFFIDEISRQYERGDKLEDMIYAAYSSGQKQLIIPPGDYRLRESGSVPPNTNRHSAIKNGAELSSAVIRLQGLRRPDDNPLHIIGKGVTVWFTPTDKPRNHVNWGILLHDCANIIFDGIVFDAAIPTTFGGRVTKVEADKGRLELELGKDSKTDLAQLNHNGQHGQEPWAVRIFPYNKKGRYMTATYDMDPATWGPSMCAVERVEASKESNRVWLYFAKELRGVGPVRKSMLEIMSTKAWQDAYGEENTITPGCFIYGQWGISVIFDAINCKKITLVNIENYHPASFLAFTGGYGGHAFINVKGIPRPGTCRLAGGYATGRIQDLEHGPVFDRVIQYHNEDDGYHICGHYFRINKVNGRNIEVGYDGINLRPGVVADVLEKERKSWLAKDIKITKVVSSCYQGAEKTVIELDREMAIPEGSFITFPEFNNDGWVIRNSYFIHCYQRLLNQGGRNAVFENNYVYGVGSGLKFESQYDGSEGGRTENIVIRNNIIAGTSYGQTKHTCNSIVIETSQNFLDDAKNVIIKDNIIIAPGLMGIWMDRTKGGTISGNVIINPLAPYAAYHPDVCFTRKAVAIERSSDVAVSNNILIEKKQLVCAEPGTGEWFAAIDNEENKNVTSRDNRYLADIDGKLSEKIQKIMTGIGPVKQVYEEIVESLKIHQQQMVKVLPGSHDYQPSQRPSPQDRVLVPERVK